MYTNHFPAAITMNGYYFFIRLVTVCDVTLIYAIAYTNQPISFIVSRDHFVRRLYAHWQSHVFRTPTNYSRQPIRRHTIRPSFPIHYSTLQCNTYYVTCAYPSTQLTLTLRNQSERSGVIQLVISLSLQFSKHKLNANAKHDGFVLQTSPLFKFQQQTWKYYTM